MSKERMRTTQLSAYHRNTTLSETTSASEYVACRNQCLHGVMKDCKSARVLLLTIHETFTYEG